MKSSLLVTAGLFLLAGCGGQTPAENNADALEEAAGQSTPAAAEVLENAATQIETRNISDPAAVDQALKTAGNVQSVQDQGLPPAPPPSGPPPAGNGQ